MTAPQAIFTGAAVAVVVAIVLACAGVATLWGAGWAMLAAGVLIGPTAVSAAVVLLRDSATK